MFDELGNPIDTSGDILGDTSTGADTGIFGGFDSLSNLGAVVPTGFSLPGIRGGLAGNPGRVMRGGAGALIAAGTGARIAMRKVWAMVKQFGPDVAAGALGYSVPDLISALFASGVMTRKRRRRGISGRDIATTRRVCRFAHSLNAQLAHCGGRRRRSH